MDCRSSTQTQVTSPPKKVLKNAVFCPFRTSCCFIRHWCHCRHFQKVLIIANKVLRNYFLNATLREHPKQLAPSSVSAPPSAFPSGTGTPQPVPTDGQGYGTSIYLQCHPIDPSAVPAPDPATPSDATLTLTPSGPVPTDAPPVSASGSVTDIPPVPTDGYGSGGPAYICQPIDSASVPQPSGALADATSTPIPSDPLPTSDAPSVSALPSGTSVPLPIPTDNHGSGAPIFICYPLDASQADPTPSADISDDATLTPTPSDPAPTSTLPVTA